MSKASPTYPLSFSSFNTSKNKSQHARITKVKEIDEENDEEPKIRIGVYQVINSINDITKEERKDFLTKAFTQKDF